MTEEPQNTPDVSDLEKLILFFSDPRELEKFRAAKLQEAAAMGLTPDKQIEYAATERNKHVRNILLPQLIEATLGKEKAAQFRELLKKGVERQSELSKGELDLFKKFYDNVQAEQNKALKNWVDLNLKIRDDAYAAVVAPLQFQANMAALISGIGVLVSVFPGYEGLGNTMMNTGETMAKTASKKIMELEKELKMLPLEEVEKRAELMRKTFQDKHRDEILKNMGKDLDGKPINDLYKDLLGIAPSPSRRVSGRDGTGFVLGSYSDKNNETLNRKVAAMNRASPYDDEMKAAAAKYGLDWRELKLRMVVESEGQAFETDRKTPLKSPQGALGLMQFMPDTAKAYGINPADPKESIHGAAQLVAEALKKHGGKSDMLDFEYYGGSNQSAWGPNTKQYVENLKLLRAKTLGAPVITYDATKIILAKAKDTSKPVAAAATPSVKVGALDDRHNQYTSEANQAFALNQPAPKGVDSRDVSHNAGVTVVADLDENKAKNVGKKGPAVNDPVYILAANGPGGGFAG